MINLSFINTRTITTKMGKREKPYCTLSISFCRSLFTHFSPTKQFVSSLRFFFLSKPVSSILTFLFCCNKEVVIKKVCRTCDHYKIKLCWCKKKQRVVPYEYDCKSWVAIDLKKGSVLVAKKSSHQSPSER